MTSKFTENKRLVLNRLRAQNAATSRIDEIITFSSKLSKRVESLQTENDKLQLKLRVLEQQNEDLQQRCNSTITDAEADAKIRHLEHKVLDLQEELTKVHRDKGDTAENLLKLTNEVKSKDSEKKVLVSKIERLESDIVKIQENTTDLQTKIYDKDKALKDAKEEHEALNLAYNAVEERFSKLEIEHTHVLNEHMALKSKMADFYNKQNEEIDRQRQANLKRDLNKHASVHVDVNEAAGDDLPVASVYCQGVVLVPSRAQQKWDAHDGEVASVRWAPSSRFFATGGSDRRIKLWSVQSGRVERTATLQGSNAAVMCLDFDPSEECILGGSVDYACRVWKIFGHRMVHSLTGHGGKVFGAKFMQDNTVVTGSYDRTLKIWDLKSKACIRTIFAMSSCFDVVTSLNTIISGHMDKKIRFWDGRDESLRTEMFLQEKE